MEPATDLETIDGFARYTGYLTAGDLDGLTEIRPLPDPRRHRKMGCLAITEREQTRAFVAQGQDFYRSRDIHGVRARDIVTDVAAPGIWVGRLVLEDLDRSGHRWVRSETPTRW